MELTVPLFAPDLGQGEIDALESVIRSGWLTMGERTSEFEEQFSKLVDCDYALATNNCTAALHMALAALGIGPGDEVICPSLTFVATANAVRYCGAKPVFADVLSLKNWNLGVETITPLVNSNTKAILIVHYAGYMCDMAGITAFAKDRGLHVVEDVAHAPGANREGRSAGNWGDAGCFSFFSNKNMTTGEGGMVTTSNEELFQRMKLMRSHGMTSLTLDRHRGHAFSYDVIETGYNYRMSELNAAIGLVQLEKLPDRNERRRALVHGYRPALSGIDDLIVPFDAHPGVSACHIMPVLLPSNVDRLGVMKCMRDRGVQTSIHYRPVDTFTNFESPDEDHSHLVNTHTIGERVLTLPLFPSMSFEQVAYVSQVLGDAISQNYLTE